MPLHHHSLIAWQRADDVFITVHRLSLEAFPSIERFALGGSYGEPLTPSPPTLLKVLLTGLAGSGCNFFILPAPPAPLGTGQSVALRSRPRVSGPRASRINTRSPETPIASAIPEASVIPLSCSEPMMVGATAAMPPPA
jgi:hypothetical protein